MKGKITIILLAALILGTSVSVIAEEKAIKTRGNLSYEGKVEWKEEDYTYLRNQILGLMTE